MSPEVKVYTAIGKRYMLLCVIIRPPEGWLSMKMLRFLFGENVKTDAPRIFIDGLEFTHSGVRAVISNLRTRNKELEVLIQQSYTSSRVLQRELARVQALLSCNWEEYKHTPTWHPVEVKRV